MNIREVWSGSLILLWFFQQKGKNLMDNYRLRVSIAVLPSIHLYLQLCKYVVFMKNLFLPVSIDIFITCSVSCASLDYCMPGLASSETTEMCLDRVTEQRYRSEQKHRALKWQLCCHIPSNLRPFLFGSKFPRLFDVDDSWSYLHDHRFKMLVLLYTIMKHTEFQDNSIHHIKTLWSSSVL